MAQPVGNLSIFISGNAAPLMKTLDQTRVQIQNFGQLNIIKEAGGGGGGLLAGLIGGAGAGAVMSAVGAATSAVGSLKAGVLSAVASVGMLGAQAVQLGANYQDARTSFETFTGSAEKGTALLKRVQDLAAATPFESTQLIAQGQMLMGMGLEAENVVPALKTIGEITSGMGGGAEKLQRLSLAFGQVLAKGRLMGQEVLQFAEAGIGVKEFALTAGKGMTEFQQDMEAGRIGADVMVNTLNRLTGAGGRFFGLTGKLSGNFNATFNNLKENVTLGMQDVGLGLIEGLNKSGGMDAAKGAVEWFRANAPGIGSGLATAFERAKPLVDAFGAAVQTVAGGFVRLGELAGKEGFIGVSERSFKTLATDGVRALVVSLGALADVSIKTGGIMAGQLFVPLLKFMQRANDLGANTFTAMARVASASGFKSLAADYRASAKAMRASDPLFDVAITDARKLSRLANKTNLAEQFGGGFDLAMAGGSAGVARLAEPVAAIAGLTAGVVPAFAGIGAAMAPGVEATARIAADAAKAADALKGIGQIKPPNLIAPDVAARALELRKGLEGADPLANFEKAKHLTLQAGIQQRPDTPRLSMAGVRFGLVDAFKDLEKALGDTTGKIPNAVQQGTVEAQRAINAAMTQADKNNIQVRVLETLKRAEQYQRETKDGIKTLSDELLRSRVTGRGI